MSKLRIATTLGRGDRVRWGENFGYVTMVLHAIDDGLGKNQYARLTLDDGSRVLLGPHTDMAPLSVVFHRSPLRLISAKMEP